VQSPLALASQLIRLCRPQQWIKNGFVLTGLLFGKAWTDPVLTEHALLATLSFCFASSAVYIVNDWADIEADRAHPVKKFRPLAAGYVSLSLAATVIALLTGLALLVASAVGAIVVWIVIGYFVLNVAYSLYAKHLVIVDIFVIAGGFMLRILAGTLGIGIPPSKWLLLCGLMVTLFLGFAKRRAEVVMNSPGNETGRYQLPRTRRVLFHYNTSLLDNFLNVTASAALITYSLYTVDADTVARHSTENLIYTVPVVLFGLFRYLYLIQVQHGGQDPSKDLVKDPYIAAAVLGWILLVVLILK
jgi:4-hydroxybenzoate polyprenyltransferase